MFNVKEPYPSPVQTVALEKVNEFTFSLYIKCQLGEAVADQILSKCLTKFGSCNMWMDRCDMSIKRSLVCTKWQECV